MRKLLTGILKWTYRLTLAAVLFVLALLLILYSGWGQERVRQALLATLNSRPGTEARLDRLSLTFPLDLELGGLLLVQDGDTAVAARDIRADVSLLPLLRGEVAVESAVLSDAAFRMGHPDSALYMSVDAGELLVKPARVRLSDMDIDITHSRLAHARVNLAIGADTAAAPVDTAAATAMAIHLRDMQLQDVTYRMSLMPVFSELTAAFPEASVTGGDIDLLAQTVNMQAFTGAGLDIRYIMPDSAQIAAWPVAPADTTATKPWTIDIDRIAFTGASALYTTDGYTPEPGLDFGYIVARDMDLTVNRFHNRAEVIDIPLALRATEERCGLTLAASGTVATDAAALYLRDFNVATDLTDLSFRAMMGNTDIVTDPSTPLRLSLDGHAGFPDLMAMFPGLALYMRGFGDSPMDLGIDVDGTSGRLAVNRFDADITRALTLKARGALTDLFGDTGIDLDLSGHIFNIKGLLAALVDPSSPLAVPPMTLDGHVRMGGGDLAGRLDARTLGGRLALDASLKGAGDVYSLDVDADRFPVNAFMPALGVGTATLRLRARGNGFDLMDPRTTLDASLDAAHLAYDGVDYHDFTLDALLDHGLADISASIDNPGVKLDIKAAGNLTGDTYSWDADIQGTDIDLLAIKLSDTPAMVTVDMRGHADYTPRTGAIQASVELPQATYSDNVDYYDFSHVDIAFLANDTVTDLRLTNRDLSLTATARAPLDSLSLKFAGAMDILDRQYARHELVIDSVQNALPPFTVNLTAGTDNMLYDLMEYNDMAFDRLTLSAVNAADLSLGSAMTGFRTGDTRLDSLGLSVFQDGDKMQIRSVLDNRPGTLDDFAHVALTGVFNRNKLALRITQRDIEGKTGYDLGVNAALSDSLINARLFPLSPVIGYRQWRVNLDNYLSYNYLTRHIDANIRMTGGNSEIALYTSHDHHGHDGGHDGDHDDGHGTGNDINLSIKDLKLQELISFNPFAPPVSGNLSANLHLLWDGASTINGDGTLGLTDFYYDKQRVGDFGADLDLSTNIDGMIRARAALSIDGERSMVLSGNLNDTISDSPFNLGLEVIRLPLSVANPFLTSSVAQLTGTLNGNFDITGDTDHPVMNGEIYFENAAAKVAMTNTSYRFSDVHVPMVDNVVTFDNFSIYAANDNPLSINGRVDLRQMSAPSFDLTLKAANMLAVNSSRPARNAQVYGKLLLNIDASVRGNLNFANVKASVGVQPGTNITYVLTEDPAEYTAASMAEMVKFVNLADSTAVMAADSLAQADMMLMVNASLNIQSGTTLTIDLPSSARDKVVLQPQGSLNYTQAPMSDGRMTGRLNIDGGNVHYTLPVIGSEKQFTFQSGSYVAFNGDILNPVLNIHAVDRLKANVTQSGQNSRLIDFDVMLGVTGTLETMDVAFDLSTDDDITVANELQAMTPTQRANQAMNLLLYNMYTGPGTSADANLTVNPLYSFLESQINNWAAKNIKGVDLSFGIDQYDQTLNGASTTTMNYSYRVSKTLFNDRFKIVVGGNYNTDDNADENISENLINDISFEYYLNDQQTMLLKVFRHTGYESILEGEVTQTGVGFVYKRKLNRLSQMLPKFLRPKRRRPESK